MTATFDFDRLLESVLETEGPQLASEARVEAALIQAQGVRQRRPFIRAMDRRAWPAPRFSPANPAAARFATVGIVMLLTIALVATALVVGDRLRERPVILPGAWSATGPTATQRDDGASAILPDGRVLFVGGRGTDGKPAPAELFDPAMNTFEPTVGQLSSPRYSLSATTMADGTVLLAGGTWDGFGGNPTSITTAELFDPKTGAFSQTGTMITARWSHSATLLADGRRVLVVGGDTTDASAGSSVPYAAEIYDSVTGSWSAAGATFVGRFDHTATVLQDGRVLIAGGTDRGPRAATAELFDPSSRTFSEVAPMTIPRSGHGATALPDGRVLIVGGSTQTLSTDWIAESAELYDPATGRFSVTGSLATERRNPSAMLLNDGRVLVAGGWNLYGEPRSAELYDPDTGTFELAASATGGLSGSAFRLPDGRVLVAGVQPEVFDPTATTSAVAAPSRSDRTFVAIGGAMQPRSGHTATRLGDGRILIVGGDEIIDGALASAEIYDPKTGSSTATGPLEQPRSGHTALLLDDGRVLVAGGSQYAPQYELYDPVAGQFTDTGLIPDRKGLGRGPITAVQLPGGRIIVFGPAGAGTMAYELDPDQARATAIGAVYGCGGLHGAVALADGRVVVLCDSGEVLQSANIFDPGTGKRVQLAVPSGPGPVSMVRLADGRILFANGIEATSLSVYDPATNETIDGGLLPTLPGPPGSQRTAGPGLTVLADGRVLITGGSEAALWDPATGTATRIPGPIAARDGQTTTLLEDGRVLVVGGTTWPADRGAPRPPEAELFDPEGLP